MGGFMIESVAAILMKGDEVLIVKKDPSHKLAGLWEFPGGKLEKGENDETCLIREMDEELSIQIEVKELLVQYTFTLPKNTLKISAYFIDHKAKEIVLTEHSELRWVPVGDLKQYPFVHSDHKAIEALMNYMASSKDN